MATYNSETYRAGDAAVQDIEGRAKTPETYESVWDALADTEQEAANLKARAAVFHAIRRTVESWKVPQEDAAHRLGLTRPRLNDLLRGKLSRFSLDALVNIATAAHLNIEIRVTEVAAGAPREAAPPRQPLIITPYSPRRAGAAAPARASRSASRA